MATFRKPASKTRAALESSTALPPVASDVFDVGEKNANLTIPAKSTKPSRKAGPGSGPPVPADAGMAIGGLSDTASAPEGAADQTADTSLDAARTALDLTPPAAEASVAAADALAGITRTADIDAEGGKATADFAQTVDGPKAEVEGAIADLADQASHASAQASRTVTELMTESMGDTAARAAEMTSAVAGVTVPLAEAAASAIDRANTVTPNTAPAEPLGEFNARLAELFRDYLEDSLAFLAAITAVRSVPEAVAVNQQHFQRRMNAITVQSRDLTLLAGKLTAQAWKPFTPAAFR